MNIVGHEDEAVRRGRVVSMREPALFTLAPSGTCRGWRRSPTSSGCSATPGSAARCARSRIPVPEARPEIGAPLARGGTHAALVAELVATVRADAYKLDVAGLRVGFETLPATRDSKVRLGS